MTKEKTTTEVTQFKSTLLNPSLLNLVSGVFAVERTYDATMIDDLELQWYGHPLVVSIFMVGFIIGLVPLFSEHLERLKIQSLLDRRKGVDWGATLISYTLVVAGSLLLLVVLYLDVHDTNTPASCINCWSVGVFGP